MGILEENVLFNMALSFLLYDPSHRQDNTYHSLCHTSHRALAGKRNRSMGPPPMRDGSDNSSHHEWMFYLGVVSCSHGYFGVSHMNMIQSTDLIDSTPI